MIRRFSRREFFLNRRLTCTAIMFGLMPLAVHGQETSEIDFGVTSASTDPLFTYLNSSERGAPGLASAPGSTVNLNVGTGMDQTLFPAAGFLFDAVLTGINSGMIGGTQAFELMFDGSMSFNDASTDLILSIDFELARMLVVSDDGGQTVTFTSGIGANSMVDFTAGPAFPDGLTFVSSAPQEFSFTVADFQDITGGDVDITEVEPDKFVLEDFTFNSSFSASADVIPEPASIGLLAVGMAMMLPGSKRRRSRRRQHCG